MSQQFLDFETLSHFHHTLIENCAWNTNEFPKLICFNPTVPQKVTIFCLLLTLNMKENIFFIKIMNLLMYMSIFIIEQILFLIWLNYLLVWFQNQYSSCKKWLN